MLTSSKEDTLIFFLGTGNWRPKMPSNVLKVTSYVVGSGFELGSSRSSCFHGMYWETLSQVLFPMPFLSLRIACPTIPQSHHSSQGPLWSCIAGSSTFSRSSPSPTLRGLLILSWPWQKRAKPTLWLLPKLFLVNSVAQQNLSFLTSSVFSSSRLLAQCPSAAQAWLGDFDSGLRASIHAAFCDDHPLTPPDYPTSSTSLSIEWESSWWQPWPDSQGRVFRDEHSHKHPSFTYVSPNGYSHPQRISSRALSVLGQLCL